MRHHLLEYCSVALIFIMSIGCESNKKQKDWEQTKIDWEQTRIENAIQSYNQFLQKHPQSQFADSARLMIETLDFQQAKESNRIILYERYLQNYPNGRFVNEAQNALNKFKAIKVIIDEPNRLKGYSDLPFETDIKNVFRGAGFRVFGAGGVESDATLTVTIDREAISAQYSDSENKNRTVKLYRGAVIRGTFTLAQAGKVIYNESFYGRVDPPTTIPKEYWKSPFQAKPEELTERQWDEPQDAPFREAYQYAGCFEMLFKIIGAGWGTEPLVAYVESGSSIKETIAITNALTKLNHPDAIKPLLSIVSKPGWYDDISIFHERDLDLNIVRMLGDFRDPRTLTSLYYALKSSKLERRSEAMAALEKTDPNWRTSETHFEIIVDEIATATKNDEEALNLLDPNWRESDAANRAIPRIIDKLIHGENSEKAGAIWTLSELKDKRAVKPLIEILKDNRNPFRENAAIALGKIEGPEVVELLLSVIFDDSWHVYDKEKVIKVIVEIDSPKAIELLVSALKDKNSRVRKNALWALGLIQDNLPGVMKEWGTPVGKSVWALGLIQNNLPVDPLLGALEDEDKSIRKEAWSILRKMAKDLVDRKDPRVVEGFLRDLKDEDCKVRTNAVWALGKLKDVRAVEDLIKVLNGKSGSNCGTHKEFGGALGGKAAEALGELADHRAIGPLINALKNDELYESFREDLRNAAHQALNKININWRKTEEARKAVDRFIKALKHKDAAVREEAVRALIIMDDERAVEALKIVASQDKESRIRWIADIAIQAIHGKLK